MEIERPTPILRAKTAWKEEKDGIVLEGANSWVTLQGFPKSYLPAVLKYWSWINGDVTTDRGGVAIPDPMRTKPKGQKKSSSLHHHSTKPPWTTPARHSGLQPLRILALWALFASRNPRRLASQTRAGLEPSEVFYLLSSIPALHSLFLADSAPIFSDEGRALRAQPMVNLQTGSAFMGTYGLVVTQGLDDSIYATNHPVERGSSHFICSEMTGTQRLSMNLICLITDMLRNEFPIRNHEYEALREMLDA
ncbi:hypothetical protein BKA70DRAFT_1238432 [Coprinopsis sp. MPI-PUGE-AT-0042]|nr:hypothetical protein BKA70DRAFT_1238432 [Coprinopsis sp. MPI-PUGE-AT-0042]